MISKMEHIAIIVKDMDLSIEFYSTMFGFELRLRGSTLNRERAFLYLEKKPEMEIELIRDIKPSQQYSDNGLVTILPLQLKILMHLSSILGIKALHLHRMNRN